MSWTEGLCVVGRADACGLGTMTEEFCRTMRPERLVVIDTGRGMDPGYRAWAGRSIVVTRPQWQRDPLTAYLRETRTVVGFETWYRDDFPSRCRHLGVRSVMFPMWEWTPDSGYESDTMVNLCATDYMTSKYRCFTGKPLSQTVLLTDWPRPDGPALAEPAWPPKTFVHCAGRAQHNRNGTREVLLAARHLRGTGARLVVYAQFDVVGGGLWTPDPEAPVELRGEAMSRQTMLASADCCVYPRRLPGHSLPINEALGSGIPTVTLELPDWRGQSGYQVTAIPQPAERWGTQADATVWRADPDELGLLMKAMAEGRVVRVPQWRPPTWDQFRIWWGENV